MSYAFELILMHHRVKLSSGILKFKTIYKLSSNSCYILQLLSLYHMREVLDYVRKHARLMLSNSIRKTIE